MRKDGFQLMSTSSTACDFIFKEVSISDMITNQSNSLKTALTSVVEVLLNDEARHRAMHRKQKLQDIFHDGLGYDFSKAMEATYGNNDTAYGAICFQQISRVLEELKVRMDQRGILRAYGGFNVVFQLLEYPMDELQKFFGGGGSTSALTDKGAYIFIFFVQKQFDELLAMAKEIDDEYDKDPTRTT
jgi:hypothetical protein